MPSLAKALTLALTVAYIPLSSAFTVAPTTFSRTHSTALNMSEERRYTIPDQPARFARAKAENNERYLNIDSVYDPSYIKGKRVAITGANRGIGLALAKELVAQGGKLVALVRSTSDELEALKPDEIITGVEVTSDEACEAIASKIKGGPIDILVNNAGYFYEPVEKVTDNSLNFKEQLKMIDKSIKIFLEVSSINKFAIKLYEKLGYKAYNERKNYYKGNSLNSFASQDSILFAKSLDDIS